MKISIENEQLEFQALRMLSEASSGQADVNEVIDTAHAITIFSARPNCSMNHSAVPKIICCLQRTRVPPSTANRAKTAAKLS